MPEEERPTHEGIPPLYFFITGSNYILLQPQPATGEGMVGARTPQRRTRPRPISMPAIGLKDHAGRTHDTITLDFHCVNKN